MPEWKPEYDKVKAVKRSADESQGPDKALTSGAGCVLLALAAVGIGLFFLVYAFMQATNFTHR